MRLLRGGLKSALHFFAPRFPLPARCSLLASRAKKEPRTFFRRCGAYTWRRPTLTGPIVPLPLALQRFTSGFGMGPGGSTALWSPEGNIEVHEAAAVQFKTGALGTGLGCRVRSAECQVEELLLTFHFSLPGLRRAGRSLTSIWSLIIFEDAFTSRPMAFECVVYLEQNRFQKQESSRTDD